MENVSRRTCGKCGLGRAREGQRYCRACHAAWMRDNRKPLNDEQRKRANCRSYTKELQKRGKLPKGPCEVCGDPEAQNHHPDYSKPREFRRLCKKHHREHHASRLDQNPRSSDSSVIAVGN